MAKLARSVAVLIATGSAAERMVVAALFDPVRNSQNGSDSFFSRSCDLADVIDDGVVRSYSTRFPSTVEGNGASI